MTAIWSTPRARRGISRGNRIGYPTYRAAAVVVLALSLQSSVVPGVLAQAAPTTAPMDAALMLGPGDRINVSVFGQPDLSGDHTLDSHGNIMLAIGGTIRAANLSTAELERKITETLASGYLVRPRVSVRVGELRPVYVLGNVRTGGAVPYRYGMTVLTAVAMASGTSGTQDAMSSRSDILATEERLQVLLDQRVSLRARIARLAAQRDGMTTLDFPSDLLSDNQATRRILDGERAVFEGERAAETRQIKLLLQQMKDSEAEVASIAEQVELARKQLEVINGYLADLGRLVRSGLIERRRVIEMQQEKARLESSIAQLGTQSVRATQVVREAPLRMSDVRASAHQTALVALQEANIRLAEMNTSIEASRDLLVVRRERMETGGTVRTADRTRFQVTRNSADGPRIFIATEATPLQPGDILRVMASPTMRTSDVALDHSSTTDIRRP